MTSISTKVARAIECPVCLEVYSDIRLPKFLSCSHNVCIECLSNLLENHSVSCPTCRKSTDLSSLDDDLKQLPTNFGIRDVAENMCPECWTHYKTGQCFHCMKDLCDPCKQSHFQQSKTEVEKLLDDAEKKISRLKTDTYKNYDDIVIYQQDNMLEYGRFWSDVKETLNHHHNEHIRDATVKFKEEQTKLEANCETLKKTSLLVQLVNFRKEIAKMTASKLSFDNLDKIRIKVAEDLSLLQRSTCQPSQIPLFNKVRAEKALNHFLDCILFSNVPKPSGRQTKSSVHHYGYSILIEKARQSLPTFWSLFTRRVIIALFFILLAAVIQNYFRSWDEPMMMYPDYCKASFHHSTTNRGRTLQDVAVSPSTGCLYVIDAFYNSLLIYDKDLNFVSEFGPLDHGLSHSVAKMYAIVVHEDSLFVTNPIGPRIHKWRIGEDCRCRLDNEFEESLKRINEELFFPFGITVDDSGFIFIGDQSKVKVFDKQGEFMRQFGVKIKSGLVWPLNTLIRQFSPLTLSYTHDGNIVTADHEIIYEFTKNGELVRQIHPILGTKVNNLLSDKFGNILYTHTSGVIVIRQDNSFCTIGSKESQPGSFTNALGLSLTSDHNGLIIIDKDKSEIQRWVVPMKEV